MKKWLLYPLQEDLSKRLAQEFNISALTAQVLANRGIKNRQEAEIFLKPSLQNLRDPFEIPNIEAAARRVLAARERGEKITVFGDYDVDGVTGTAILLHTLKHLGIAASYYIPHRYGEGYSLSLESVKKIAEDGTKLIITVDCGISSRIEIEEANALGVEVVVTDHHNLPKELPNAYSVVNPKLIAGDHPSKFLSGAGVAFKFGWALLRTAGVKDSVFLTSLLDLASLGTISDVVPLTAENRVLAINGLNLLNERKRSGIKYLAEAANLNGKISIDQVNFGLAPRLNAAGRLEHASKSLELLTTDDPVQARSLAQELNRINSRRQDIGSQIQEEVFSQLSEEKIKEENLVVLSGEGWHPGVIGIVASRVVDRYYRPVVLIGVNDGVGRGSARSVDGFSIYDLLDKCRDLYLDFGGHENAAGFEISSENISELSRRLKSEMAGMLNKENLTPKIFVDEQINPSDITMSFIKELELLSPFGEGNPAPVFMSRGLELTALRRVGSEGRHLKAKFAAQGAALDTIGFDLGHLAEGRDSPQLIVGNNYDIAYNLETNEWDGFEVAQLSLMDVREAKA